MIPVYTIATNITSALGMDAAANMRAALTGRIGVKQYEDAALSNNPFYASRLDAGQWQAIHAQVRSSQSLSPFEQLAVYSAIQAVRDCPVQLDIKDTVLVLSTTKGNIEWLGQVPDERLLLHTSAKIIAGELGVTQKPVVVSHACMSGVAALLHAQRMIENGQCRHAIVIGCDRFSRFVLSGFQSFQAVADAPCRPFDADRKGINLGEAAASIILSATAGEQPLAQLLSGATTNDANHISGPSRTGEELSLAINRSLSVAGITANEIDIISAHGTATLYNDEMEAKAFNLSGLADKPVHSFKGYTGHTLGAAGVLESVMLIEALQYQQLIPSAGFETPGVPVPLNVTTQPEPANIKYALKTASGFGGCNAAAVWKKAD